MYLHEKLKEIEQNILIKRWIKKKGISFEDLDRHPQIDDVILMLKVRELKDSMNSSEIARWGAIWNTVYYKKRALNSKNLTKIQNIVVEAQQRHNYKQQQYQAQLNKIKEMRENQETHKVSI
jgi:hypothetical protein